MRGVGRVSYAQLRRLYQNCRALVTASYEDFGLTPFEANAFGRPAVVLRAGGFLDTFVEGVTGVFPPRRPKQTGSVGCPHSTLTWFAPLPRSTAR